jgi:3-oxoacyl-[acyl-carrier-protein] synthase III
LQYRAIEYVLPSRKLTNDDMIRMVSDNSREFLTPRELAVIERKTRWLFRSMGTDVRYWCAEGEVASDLCVKAGERALDAAGMAADDIDLLIYVGVGRGFMEPATANVFQDKLGLRRATCFDVLDACASWLRAIHIAQSFLATGAYRHIMILNGEFNRTLGNFGLRSTQEFDFRFPTYTVGEAATATIVTASDTEDGYRADFRTYGDQRDLCLIPLPNWEEYLAKDGHSLQPYEFYSWGRRLMEFGLEKLVEQATELTSFHTPTPDLVFFHAASDGMSREGMRRMGIDADLGFYTHHRFGNTVSATLPMAMAVARADGRLQEGSEALVAFASAGVSTALLRFRYLGA